MTSKTRIVTAAVMVGDNTVSTLRIQKASKQLAKKG